jgi:type I restriction enzyme S subunit
VDALQQFFICMPPAQVAEAFGQVIEPMMALVRQHMEECRTLAGLRDMLLPRLMSGEVRVQP